MSAANCGYTVSFTVNTCGTDAPLLDKTLRQMIHSLNYPFYVRLVAYETGRPEGKYLERAEGEDDQMRLTFSGLLADGVID